jgi:hypothetical protein
MRRRLGDINQSTTRRSVVTDLTSAPACRTASSKDRWQQDANHKIRKSGSQVAAWSSRGLEQCQSYNSRQVPVSLRNRFAVNAVLAAALLLYVYLGVRSLV